MDMNMDNFKILRTIWEHKREKIRGEREGAITFNFKPCPLGKVIALIV
jgi:hypothetical protein